MIQLLTRGIRGCARVREKSCKGTTFLLKMQKNTRFLHFFSKIFGHVFGLRPRILRRSCTFGRRLGLHYV